MDALRVIVILHLMISVSAAANLLGDCTANTECPVKSLCVHRGCDGLKCVCQDNYMPSEDESRCVKIAEIGESCDGNSRCRGQSSRCNGNICVCDPDHIPAVLEVTSEKKITYCQLKPFLGTQPLLLGQNCKNENAFCSDVLGKTFCKDGTCQCVKGYRNAFLEEINTFPYQLLQCVPSNFKLHVSTPSDLCPFNPVGTTSTSTPYSTSVSSNSSPSVSKRSSLIPTISTVSIGLQSGTSKQQVTSTSEKPIQTSQDVAQFSSGYNGGKSITFTSVTEYVTAKYTSFNYLRPSEASVYPSSILLLKTSSIYQAVTTINAQETISPSSPVTVMDTRSPSSLKYNSPSSISSYSCYSQSSCNVDLGHNTLTNGVKVSSKVSKSQTETVSNNQTPALSPSKQSSATNTYSDVQSTLSKVTISATSTLPASTVKHSTTVSSSTVSDKTTIDATQLHTESTSGVYLTTVSPSSTTTNGNVLQTVLDGADCNTSSVCMADGICELDRCGIHRCRCQKGYILDLTKTIYRKLNNLGGHCEDDTTCIGPFTKCSGGICRCKEDYVKSSDGQWCTHKTSWFINFPLLGDKCSNFFSECFHASEQTCQNDKCQCKTGLRQASDKDLPIPSNVYYQCRNASLEIGGREPRDCQDGPETFPADPYYNAALKRIRKMQGIILGSVAGFVVVICIIIAGLCYHRHRNRTMVQDMTSDKGSVVSFDRQSSGKYSFKIPRPFMPIIKDWDTDHLSYANSTFTADDSDVLKGDQTLRSSRSIPFPDQSEPEGYNRPSQRKTSISTASTVDIETSSTGDFELKNVEDTIETKNYQANHINLESGEG